MVDVRSGTTPALRVRASGRRVRYVRALPAAAERADIALGVYDLPASESAAALAAWAGSAAVPLLAVAFGDGRAFVGPLTIPGRVGCAHCANQRLRAAAGPSAAGPGEGAVTDRLLAALADELEEIDAVGASTARLVDHVLSVDGDDLSRHRVVPLARCPICGGAAASTGEPESDDPLAGWVDPVTGVIPALSLDPPLHDGAPLPVVVTAAPPTVVDADGSLRRLPSGWGKGLTPAEAVLSAVGEAVERYAASLPDPARVVWARADELEGARLEAAELPLYSDAQYADPAFPYVPYDRGARHPWVRGEWLGSGGGVWVPAVFAFLALTLEPENLICQGTSNGLAASADPDEAALRAVLELVERDALLSAWATRTPGIRIVLDDSLEPGLARILEGVEQAGATVEPYVLPTGVCGTTAACLALGDGIALPGAALGAAADLDPARAVRGAVLELGQTLPYLSRLLRSGAVAVPESPEAVREMLDHAAFYFPAGRASAFDSLRAAREQVPLAALLDGPPERSLRGCARLLSDAGVRVALVDVTSPDVATTPFRVVRAVSPDLQPLFYGYGLERAPVERLRRALPAEPSPIHPIW